MSKHKNAHGLIASIAAVLREFGHSRAGDGKVGDRTREKRATVLFLVFRQLREMGFKLPSYQGLGNRHVTKLCMRWDREGLSEFIQTQKRLRKAKLFIPNICIAEVLNAFARKRFRPERPRDVLDEESYKRCLSNFRDHIHWGRTLYPYDLNRYHIVAADKIIPVEHRLATSRGREYLSTFDILVFAMVCELAYTRECEETLLVTCDRRMKDVTEELRTASPGSSTPDGPLGRVENARWVPPN